MPRHVRRWTKTALFLLSLRPCGKLAVIPKLALRSTITHWNSDELFPPALPTSSHTQLLPRLANSRHLGKQERLRNNTIR